MSVTTYSPPSRTTQIPRSVELAYREIDIQDRTDREYLRATSGGDSSLAWINYRRIGEVRYAISRSARIAGYGTLKAVRVNSAGTVVEERDTGVVADIVNGIYSRSGGTRGLIERFYTLRKVPGEAFLIATRDKVGAPRDGYWFMSPSEILRESVTIDEAIKGNKPVIWQTSRAKSVDGSQSAFRRTVEPKDFLGRIWSPDGEFIDDADSPMQSINDMCEMLHKLTESIMGRLRQRFALAGILLIPNEIGDAAISGDQPSSGKYSNDKVLNYLIHIMTQNVAAHATATAQVPILLKGPADVLDKVKHLLLESQVAETDLKLRSELISRILDGLDQQKGAVSGGQGENHWRAWLTSDEERRITVQPDLEAMCHALTRLVLWKQLKEEREWPDARILPWRIWYDLSAAAVKSNMGEDARQAWDRGEVNGAFLRLATGAGDLDVMDPDEKVRWAGLKTQNAYLMCHGLEGIEVDWEKAAAWGKVSGPAPESPADDQEVGPGVGSPGSPSDRDSDTPKTETPG